MNDCLRAGGGLFFQDSFDILLEKMLSGVVATDKKPVR